MRPLQFREVTAFAVGSASGAYIYGDIPWWALLYIVPLGALAITIAWCIFWVIAWATSDD